MPCPHFSISIVKRSERRSAVAAAAYQSCSRIYSEYEMKWKDYTAKQKELVHEEVMLPDNAPPEYADRRVLWNAVEDVEKQWNAQLARRFKITLPRELTNEQNLALLKQYCREQFVSKGMIADVAFHDPDPPGHNPHFHLLLTLRAINEQGRWLPKGRKVYDLDENGQRILLPSGRWKSHKENTVDWNEQKYGEIWRHEWEVLQNRYLEQAGRPERVDLRSFERQGNPHAPQIHLGPAVTAMERKGIRTYLGDLNREIIAANKLFDSIRRVIRDLTNWLGELSEKMKTETVASEPEEQNLALILSDYLSIRKDGRSDWSRAGQTKAQVNDLKQMSAAIVFLQQNEITTVRQLGEYLNRTGAVANDLRSRVKANDKRTRDIDAILEAVKTLRELQPIHDQYAKIGWKSRKEKFAADHADELEKYNKAIRLLKKLEVKLPINSKSLRDEQKELRKSNIDLTSQLEVVQADLDELKQVRWCVRQVIPDALPTVKDGRVSALDRLESNRRKIEQEQKKEQRKKQDMEL